MAKELTFTVEERTQPIDALTDAVRALTEGQQVRVSTNGLAPTRLAVLLHGRLGKGAIHTTQTGAHELCVWKK